MPIGTIIGWLIGQLCVCLIVINSNHPSRDKLNDPEIKNLRVITRNICWFGVFTAAAGLIGTLIELIVR